MKPTELIDKKAPDSAGKAPLDLIPPCAAEAEAHVLYHGAVTKGRGKWNWRQPGQGCHLMGMIAAIERHCLAIKRGEDIDRDSGLHHLAHIRAGAGIIMDAQQAGSLVDDRPSKVVTHNPFFMERIREGQRLANIEACACDPNFNPGEPKRV